MAVENVNDPQPGYISVDEAATVLGVSRTNVYYYLGQMEIKTTTFPLSDRKAYIRRTDLEMIKVARGTRDNSARISSDDVLVFLAGLGLAVTPHSDPSYGWGYSWFGGNWDGPYPTQVDAIQAAFERADQQEKRLRDMPFPTSRGELYWWDGQEWYTARHKDGELQIRTFNHKDNDGYERVEDVEAEEAAWLRPVPPTGDAQLDDELARARLAARMLHNAFQIYQMTLEPIDWQHKRLKAPVVVNGTKLGTLLPVYNRILRKENSLEWLNKKLAAARASEGDNQPDEKE